MWIYYENASPTVIECFVHRKVSHTNRKATCFLLDIKGIRRAHAAIQLTKQINNKLLKMTENYTIFVHRKKKATTRAELEKFTKDVWTSHCCRRFRHCGPKLMLFVFDCRSSSTVFSNWKPTISNWRTLLKKRLSLKRRTLSIINESSISQSECWSRQMMVG